MPTSNKDKVEEEIGMATCYERNEVIPQRLLNVKMQGNGRRGGPIRHDWTAMA